MRRKHFQFVAGILVGGILFSGGAAQAAELFYKAIPSPNAVYLDGERVELAAMAINGNNYVKLRDVGKLVGFNVYWDGANVQVDSDAPYTGTAPDNGTAAQSPTPEITPAPVTTSPSQSYTISTNYWSREDFSRQANPAVFTSVFDRNLYNAVRQTIVDMGTENSLGGRCAYTMVSKGNYGEVKRMIGRMDGLWIYEHYVPENFANYYEYLDYFALSAEIPEQNQAPLDFIQPVLNKVSTLASDRDKVIYLNDYLCSLLDYEKGKTATMAQIFSPHPVELQATCATYARAFKFLCAAAGIPCFAISTSTHGWNMVYVDGQWLHVDVSTNDNYNRPYILLSKTVENRVDQAPEATAFLKELLVPGSTK